MPFLGSAELGGMATGSGVGIIGPFDLIEELAAQISPHQPGIRRSNQRDGSKLRARTL